MGVLPRCVCVCDCRQPFNFNPKPMFFTVNLTLIRFKLKQVDRRNDYCRLFEQKGTHVYCSTNESKAYTLQLTSCLVFLLVHSLTQSVDSPKILKNYCITIFLFHFSSTLGVR